jgi:hypothetical protein
MCDCSSGPKATYKVGELAELAGLSRHVVRRLLRKNAVTMIPNGRTPLVPLSGLRSALPILWDSIAEARGLRG